MRLLRTQIIRIPCYTKSLSVFVKDCATGDDDDDDDDDKELTFS